jgi:hypothetical protein
MRDASEGFVIWLKQGAAAVRKLHEIFWMLWAADAAGHSQGALRLDALDPIEFGNVSRCATGVKYRRRYNRRPLRR